MLVVLSRISWGDVALLAEGVDRNTVKNVPGQELGRSPSSRRAWIEIPPFAPSFVRKQSSPSSRRAWIEMQNLRSASGGTAVALLAEGVDRNPRSAPWLKEKARSPSSRRAWIEIADDIPADAPAIVALLAEGVDRNGRASSARPS